MKNSGALRAIEVIGVTVAIFGFVLWYATPSDVVFGPLAVMVLGAIVAGIPWLIRRSQGDQEVNDLARKATEEREREQNE